MPLSLIQSTGGAGGSSTTELIIPTGVINNSNTVFTLPSAPAGDVVVFLNGLCVVEANYTVVGTTLTFGSAPLTGNTLQVLLGTFLAGLTFNNANLTGVSTAPTAAPGTNTTQISNTAFVVAAAALKANTSHTHAQADITNLVSDLAGKEAAGTAASAVSAHLAVSNPHSVTKAMVGLSNADNTSDANKPVSTATQTALDLKANLASPTLTGTPLSPTAAPGTDTTQIASTAFVKAAVLAGGGGVSLNDAALTGATTADRISPNIHDLGTVASGTVTMDAVKSVNKVVLTGTAMTVAFPSGGARVQQSIIISNTNGSSATITIPSSKSENRGATITSFVLAAGVTVTVTWIYDGAVYHVLGDPITSAQVKTALAIVSTDLSDFNSASRAQTEAALVAGSNITITAGSSGATRTLTVASSGGGAVATDVIWDAAGDLAVGTGSNTAAKLAIGTALQVLRVNAGATALEYAAAGAGSGDVTAAASFSTDNVIVRSDGTGKGVQASTVRITDAGDVEVYGDSIPGSIRLADADATSPEVVTITAPVDITTSYTAILPAAQGTVGQVLSVASVVGTVNTLAFAAPSVSASDLASGIVPPARLLTFNTLYPVWTNMGASEIDVTKANSKSLSGNITLTYSATPATDVQIPMRTTTDGTARVITLPAGTHLDESGVTITTFTQPASTTLYWGIVKTAAGYNVRNTSQTPAQVWVANRSGVTLAFRATFDPKAVCDGAIDRLFLGTIGADFPLGFVATAWKKSFEADPTTESDMDLKFADAFIGVANSAVMDVLDTTAGVSSESTPANINAGATVANGKVLYLEFGTAYTEANHQCIFELWGYAV